MWEAADIGGQDGGWWRWVGQGELQVLMETYLLYTELGLWPLDGRKKCQVDVVLTCFVKIQYNFYHFGYEIFKNKHLINALMRYEAFRYDTSRLSALVNNGESCHSLRCQMYLIILFLKHVLHLNLFEPRGGMGVGGWVGGGDFRCLQHKELWQWRRSHRRVTPMTFDKVAVRPASHLKARRGVGAKQARRGGLLFADRTHL